MADQALHLPVASERRTKDRVPGFGWLLVLIGRAFELVPSAAKSRQMQAAIDCCASAFALFLAYQLRFDFAVPLKYRRALVFWLPAMAVLRPASILGITKYRSIWRFFTLEDAISLVVASLPASALLLAVRLAAVRLTWIANLPISVIVLEFTIFIGCAASVRGLRRSAYEKSLAYAQPRKRAVLMGTEGMLAAALAQARTVPELEVIGLLAPGERLRKREIGRAPVIGDPSILGSLLGSSPVDVILIADANWDWIAEAASIASQFGTDIRLLPSAANVMRNEVHVAAPVNAEKAFAETRIAAPPVNEVCDAYRDRVVLVTGAGGSIGSELCRQILPLGVSRLILLDHSENSMFEIQSELARSATTELVSLVGDVRERGLLDHIFSQQRPHIVLHSAAYKHVPMMEQNPSEAFLNNVIGTRNVLDAALESKCERFVLISSDKAVAPTSVMGITKRLCEMLVQLRAARSSNTLLACVRFGNVVGSRGSVVPIFLKQIAEGKPVTITDPRMSRYFMTVHEAVQLVLQASTLADDGRIYMLDMGDPVMIAGVARKLIEMSGLRPEKDVPFEVIGIRPGEKIHEELWHDESLVGPTRFSRVQVIDAGAIAPDFESDIAGMELLARSRENDELREKLRGMQLGYTTKQDSLKN